MSNTNTGGSAFPQCNYNMKGGYDITGGMTLRDYFAAKALQGMFASGNLPKSVTDEELAAVAYQTADALLKARTA
jgi:hypothetical protein